MNSDQTAPKGAVWSVSILFDMYASKDEKADNNCREWWISKSAPKGAV